MDQNTNNTNGHDNGTGCDTLMITRQFLGVTQIQNYFF